MNASAKREPSPATLESILAAVHEVGGGLRELRGDLRELRGDFEDLKRRVDGSDPPPPLNGAASPEPIALAARRGSEASFDVEELRGELLAVRTELANQSRAMGLTTRGLAWLIGPNGRKTVVSLLTMGSAVYAALHGAGFLR